MSQIRRSALILSLSASLFAATLPAAAALPPGGTFLDDNGSMFEGAIEAVAAEGITRGCNPPGNDLFCPKQHVTRGQMAAFLVRALGLAANGPQTFVDVPPDHIFHAEIRGLAAAGITKGCNPAQGNTRYCPDRAVTRAEMAAFLVRARGLTATSAISFADVPPGHLFHSEINRLATAGITFGCGGGRFCPDRPVLREEMAAFLQRALGLPELVPPPATAGNPTGNSPIPPEAAAADTSQPDRVIGDGTPGSCTSAAVVAAVAQGGVIVFDCGPNPVTIPMVSTARVFNNRPNVVLDGRGLVTLDGLGQRRILYMNTCDPDLVWTTPHCQNQDHPTLTVQNLTFVNGRSSGGGTQDGGGAIFVRGGRFKVVSSQFYSNRCSPTGPDVGGAALQVFSQYEGRPVYVVNSTFGGPGDLRNECSNGGGISSIGVSWTIINSWFRDNRAIGWGANPAESGTPGGGNGGAIYNDGNEMTLRVEGTRIEGNRSNGEGGSAIFFVSNNRTGNVDIVDSVIRNNTGDGFSTHPSIFFLGYRITFSGSVVE